MRDQRASKGAVVRAAGQRWRRSLGSGAAALLLLWLVGCSSHQSYRKAEISAQEGDWDQAVLHYMEAVETDPGNLSYRAALLRAKISASQMHFEKGKRFRAAAVLGRAMVEYQQAVQLDPTNQYAQAELTAVQEEIRAAEEQRDSVTIDELKEKTRGSRALPPRLKPRSDVPIDLDFPEPTQVKDIYRALSKGFGINILFDPSLKDQSLPLVLKQVTAQDALEVIMRTAGHFYKVQDENTIIVIPDTPQNRRKYEDLMIQTFFLSNADVKSVLTMLRSLVDAKKVAINEQLNAIILRDTADKVKVAERIIEANDKAKAEVVVDVELLQVNSTKMRNLGVQLDNYSVTQSLDLGGENVPLRVSDIDDLTTNNWVLSIPNFIYNFIKSNTDAQLLAKPQLRITEGEKARLLIGERVPIPTTTFNTSNTVGGNIVPLTTFQYTDVGIQIQIEPRVHHNKEITLKVTIEVSNIAGFVDAAGGQRQPLIGTRTIESTIRLRDGETNFLAGLIRSEELETETGIPGLSDIPVLGRLFSNNNRDDTRTDVILTMTPRIIRTPSVTEEDLLPIWVGTEQQISYRGGSPRVESDVEGPFDEDDTRERVQQLLRERLQRLPRGLQQGASEEEPGLPAPPSQGIDLAPTGGLPSSFFPQSTKPTEPEEDDFGDPDSPPVAQLPLPASAEPQLQLPEVELPGAAPPPEVADQPAALALAASSAGEASGPAVRLRLSPQRVEVSSGETFELALRVTALEPVAHLPLELRFDPQVLAVESVVDGGFMGPQGEAVLLSNHSEPGELVIGASRLGQIAPVAGSGVVARITFRAVGEGSTEVSFHTAGALNGELQPLGSVGLTPADVVVDPLAAAPPPERPGRPVDQIPAP